MSDEPALAQPPADDAAVLEIDFPFITNAIPVVSNDVVAKSSLASEIRCESRDASVALAAVDDLNASLVTTTCAKCALAHSTSTVCSLDVDDARPRWEVRPAAKKMASNAATLADARARTRTRGERSPSTTTGVARKIARARFDSIDHAFALTKEEGGQNRKGLDARNASGVGAGASSELEREPTGERKKRKVVATSRVKIQNNTTRKMPRELKRQMVVELHSAADAGDVAALDDVLVRWERDVEGKYVDALKWDTDFIMCVARDGTDPIRVIDWALNHGAKIGEDATMRAVERTYHRDRVKADGSYVSALEILQYLHRKCASACTEDTLYVACEFGEIDCVKWLIKNVPKECDVSKWPRDKTGRGKLNKLMLVAAQNGHLHVLKFLHDDCQCYFGGTFPDEAIDLVMQRDPSSPLMWHAVVKWIQSTHEWRALHPHWGGSVIA